jgi:hypothetical protein
MSCPNCSTGTGVVYGNCAGDRDCCKCAPGPKGDQGPEGDVGPTGPEGPTVISQDSGNILGLGVDGFLFLDSALLCSAGFVNNVTDSATIDLTKIGCAVTASVKSSSDAGNMVQLRSNGIYVPTPAMPTREYIEDILANTFPQFAYDDSSNTYTVASVPTSAFTGWTLGCGLSGAATPVSPLAVNRTALFGTTAVTSLEAGPDACSLQVKVDGGSIKRLGDGSLYVDFTVLDCAQVRSCLTGTGVINFNPLTGVITTTVGANGTVLVSNAGAVSWQLPVVPVSGAGTTVVTGVVNVDPDTAKGIEILSDKVAAKIGDGLKFDGTGKIALNIDPASCCVEVSPTGLLFKRETPPVPLLMCVGNIPYSVIVSQDCDGNVTGINYINMRTGLVTTSAPVGLGPCVECDTKHSQTFFLDTLTPSNLTAGTYNFDLTITNPSATCDMKGMLTYSYKAPVKFANVNVGLGLKDAFITSTLSQDGSNVRTGYSSNPALHMSDGGIAYLSTEIFDSGTYSTTISGGASVVFRLAIDVSGVDPYTVVAGLRNVNISWISA